MPKPINPSIGSCPCSFRGCTHSAEVKKEKGRRARLYLVCPSHGVINLGAAMQEYILEHANIAGPGGASTAPAPVPEPVPRGSSQHTERGPAPEPYPAGVQLERPKPAPAPVPEPSRPAPKKTATEKPTSQRKGLRPFGWLADGLSEL